MERSKFQHERINPSYSVSAVQAVDGCPIEHIWDVVEQEIPIS